MSLILEVLSGSSFSELSCTTLELFTSLDASPNGRELHIGVVPGGVCGDSGLWGGDDWDISGAFEKLLCFLWAFGVQGWESFHWFIDGYKAAILGEFNGEEGVMQALMLIML